MTKKRTTQSMSKAEFLASMVSQPTKTANTVDEVVEKLPQEPLQHVVRVLALSLTTKFMRWMSNDDL